MSDVEDATSLLPKKRSLKKDGGAGVEPPNDWSSRHVSEVIGPRLFLLQRRACC